ncbi:hypothetical protein [Solibacillus sp. FSL K6-1126]|uniref:hypothetical protein n=1 Tax=Solibacillus sp. FSL K6-1126 TaxID=2921463 RepID=UPI0030F95CD9
MNAKVKSKKMIASIFALFIVALFVAFFIFNSNTLASDEVFNDIDFESEHVTVDGYKLDRETEEIFVELKLSEDDKTAILEAFKNSKFEILSSSDSYVDGNYFINIALNKRYELELNPTQKNLIFVYEDDNDSDHKYYKISNDSGLFELLETITKESLNQ